MTLWGRKTLTSSKSQKEKELLQEEYHFSVFVDPVIKITYHPLRMLKCINITQNDEMHPSEESLSSASNVFSTFLREYGVRGVGIHVV